MYTRFKYGQGKVRYIQADILRLQNDEIIRKGNLDTLEFINMKEETVMYFMCEYFNIN